LEALLVALKKAKPAQAKGVYIKKVSMSTTMGAGVAIDQTDCCKLIFALRGR
jgi:large subunit ribosomal protein L1